jgi:predicted DCC family thiol-disulfide oxidoreductase YuxK
VVLFDGMCNLCNGFVRFVIARDPAGRFQFAPLQSEIAGRLIRQAGGTGPATESIVLIDAEGMHTRSSAALRIARRLAFPWPIAFALAAIPRPVRDWAYDAVAARRYRWFGRREVCMRPTPELRARFLSEARD